MLRNLHSPNDACTMMLVSMMLVSMMRVSIMRIPDACFQEACIHDAFTHDVCLHDACSFFLTDHQTDKQRNSRSWITATNGGFYR